MMAQFFKSTLLMLIISIPLLAQQDYAQQTSEFEEENPNIFETQTVWGIGLQAGLLSGSGLGFRYHPPGRFGYQLVGGIISLGDDTPYSVGAEGQFDFDANGLSRFYGFVGAGYYDNGKPEETDNPETPEDESDNDLESPFRIGIGVAYEWAISSKMVFNLSAAFHYFTNGDILPLPQVSVFYYFK